MKCRKMHLSSCQFFHRFIQNIPLYIIIHTTLIRVTSSLDMNHSQHNEVGDVGLKNISKILDKLLEGYDHRIRPGFGGPPVTILTNMNIRSMGPISEVDMSYSMDCYFRQSWRDERLQFDTPSLKEIQVHISILNSIWKPDTYFQNGRGSYVHMITTPNKLLRIKRDGRILYSMRLTIKASCPMYLEYFPIDQQTCPLIFSSYAYNNHDLRYNWDPTRKHAVEIDHGMTLSQFDLWGYPIRNMTVGSEKGDYSVLSVEFKLKRHMGYFLIQVYVPCILIVVLSWVSFWLNREASADRIGLGITTVLTLTTLQMDTRQNLPKVAYATALDWFVIMCFAFIIATMFQFAAVHYFTKVGFEEVAPKHSDDEESDDDDYDEDQDEKEEGNGGSAVLYNQNSVTYYNASHNHNNHSNAYTSTTQSYGNDVLNAYSSNRRHLTTVNSAEYRRQLYVTDANASLNRRYAESEAFEKAEGLYRQRSLLRDIFNCLKGNYKYRNLIKSSRRREGPVNSVSRIDKVSRILFPLAFGILNIAYWIAYTKADPRDSDSRLDNLLLQK